jgi:hypothetical protein
MEPRRIWGDSNMKMRKTFTLEGRDYSASSLKEAKALHQDEIRAGLRMLDEGAIPLFLPLPDGRMIMMHLAFGSWGYSFVNPDGRVSGGCSFGRHVSRRECEARAREHAAQYSAAA